MVRELPTQREVVEVKEEFKDDLKKMGFQEVTGQYDTNPIVDFEDMGNRSLDSLTIKPDPFEPDYHAQNNGMVAVKIGESLFCAPFTAERVSLIDKNKIQLQRAGGVPFSSDSTWRMINFTQEEISKTSEQIARLRAEPGIQDTTRLNALIDYKNRLEKISLCMGKLGPASELPENNRVQQNRLRVYLFEGGRLAPEIRNYVEVMDEIRLIIHPGQKRIDEVIPKF